VNRLGANPLLILFLVLCVVPLTTLGQLDRTKWGSFEVDYANPRKMEIGGIIISGARILDPNALTLLTGLRVGDEIDIPGIKISQCHQKPLEAGSFLRY
jgi:outer membrane protein insertion porin family